MVQHMFKTLMFLECALYVVFAASDMKLNGQREEDHIQLDRVERGVARRRNGDPEGDERGVEPGSLGSAGRVNGGDQGGLLALPVVTIVPVTDVVVVRLGKEFTIQCQVDSISIRDIKWRKNMNDITSGGRVTITRRMNAATLTIEDAQLEDSGIYTCRATNTVGFTESSKMVAVVP